MWTQACGTASARVIWAAMPLRIWVIGRRTSSAPSGNAIAAPAGALAAVLAAGAMTGTAAAPPVRIDSTTASTSSRVIRLPPPVPLICSGLRPCSRSRRRTAGVMRASGSPVAASVAAGASGAAAGAAAGAAEGAATGAAGAGASGAAVAAAGRSSEPAGPLADSAAGGREVVAGAAPADASDSSPVSMTAISASLGTVAPSSARISLRTPSNGDGTSALTLSVMTSRSGSYLSTWSPTCLSHLPIVPSATLSPSWGIVTFATFGLPPVCLSSRVVSTIPAIPVEPGRSQDDPAAIDALPRRPRRWPGSRGCPAPRGRRARRRGPRPRS